MRRSTPERSTAPDPGAAQEEAEKGETGPPAAGEGHLPHGRAAGGTAATIKGILPVRGDVGASRDPLAGQVLDENHRSRSGTNCEAASLSRSRSR